MSYANTLARTPDSWCEPPGPRSVPTSDAPVAEILRAIRELLAIGHFMAARQLALEASEVRPEHQELLRYAQALAGRSAHTKPATGRDGQAEQEWLENAPPEYVGKWVALVGADLVGSAESLKDLLAELPQSLEQPPLAVKIEA